MPSPHAHTSAGTRAGPPASQRPGPAAQRKAGQREREQSTSPGPHRKTGSLIWCTQLPKLTNKKSFKRRNTCLTARRGLPRGKHNTIPVMLSTVAASSLLKGCSLTDNQFKERSITQLKNFITNFTVCIHTLFHLYTHLFYRQNVTNFLDRTLKLHCFH